MSVCATVDPEGTSASFTLSVTTPVTPQASLNPNAGSWIKAADILRTKVAPGLDAKLRRAASVRAPPTWRNNKDHKRDVTAELNAIRRSKLKAGTKRLAATKKAAALNAAMRAAAAHESKGSCYATKSVVQDASPAVADPPQTSPTSLPEPASGQQVSSEAQRMAREAAPTEPSSPYPDAPIKPADTKAIDASDVANRAVPTRFV